MKNLKKFIPPVKKPRLSGWLLTSVLLLGTIALVSPQQLPVVIYKLALITLAAVLGYWLDRSLFPKARPGQYLKHDDRLMAEGRFPVQTGLHLVLQRSAWLLRWGFNHELAADHLDCMHVPETGFRSLSGLHQNRTPVSPRRDLSGSYGMGILCRNVALVWRLFQPGMRSTTSAGCAAVSR